MTLQDYGEMNACVVTDGTAIANDMKSILPVRPLGAFNEVSIRRTESLWYHTEIKFRRT